MGKKGPTTEEEDEKGRFRLLLRGGKFFFSLEEERRQARVFSVESRGKGSLIRKKENWA